MATSNATKWMILGLSFAKLACGGTADEVTASTDSVGASAPSERTQTASSASNTPGIDGGRATANSRTAPSISGADAGTSKVIAANAAVGANDAGAVVTTTSPSVANTAATQAAANTTPLGAQAPVAEAAPNPTAVSAQASPTAGPTRPSGNTGTGFYVAGGSIYDANGAPFNIRGVNHTHWWGSNSDNEQAIASIGRSNANTVRAVFGPGAGMGPQTPEEREALLRKYIAQGIVPMVDYHNATCQEDPALLGAAVDFWTGPDKAWVKSLERYVMVNITNEWGPASPVFLDGYKTAIARLRQAGVNNLLVIDAGGACGQDATSIERWGREIFDSDPQKNVVFSVHMYAFWKDPGSAAAGSWDGKQPFDMEKELTVLQATGLPIIVGEFSWTGHPEVAYTTRAAIDTYDRHHMGFVAWMWNNPGGASTVNMANTMNYTSSSDLTEFGKLLVEDPAVGFKAVAKKATIF